MSLRCLLLTTAFGLALAATAQAAEGPFRDGFETWKDGQPVGWKVTTGDAPVKKVTGRTGSAAQLTATRVGSGFMTALSQTQPIALKPDTLYRIVVWVKGTGAFRIQVNERSGKRHKGNVSGMHVEATQEWMPFQFYYGTEGDAIDAINLSLCAEQQGGVCAIDDVVVQRVGPVGSPGDNLVPNGDMSLDADGDGRPDGWHVANPIDRSERKLARGPDGKPALMCRTRHPGSGSAFMLNAKTWWDWSSHPPFAFPIVDVVRTPVIPVEPGRTYEWKFRLKGRDVNSFSSVLHWLKDGKRFAAGLMRPMGTRRPIGPKRHATWDWEEVRFVHTIPSAEVNGARIQFFTRPSGGRIWIDEVSVRPLSGRPTGWKLPDVETKPFQSTTPVRQAAKPPVRPKRAYTVRPFPKNTVTVNDKNIVVQLTSGIQLQFIVRDGNLLGIGAVTLGDLPLRNPDAPPIAPLVETTKKTKYVSCRYVSHESNGGGIVTIHTLLKAADGHHDKLDWIVRPIVRDIAGRRYVGFASRYRVTSESEQILTIDDRATWELGGKAVGITLVEQYAYNMDNIYPITEEDTYAGRGGTRFCLGEGLDYQYAPEGGLAIFYDAAVFHVRASRQGAKAFVRYRDSHLVGGVPTATTPDKCVLFSPVGNHDEWTRVRDGVYAQSAARWGIKEHVPMPIANCWPNRFQLSKLGDQLLIRLADEAVPKVAKLGFKVFSIHGIWSHGGCSPDFIKPWDNYGGTKALKYLCDKAAEKGMIVQAWASTTHLWQHSPLIKQNPDWLLQGPKGQPPTTYCYPNIRGMRFAAGFADYAVSAWKKVRQETGLGALWFDSYHNFIYCRHASPQQALEQAEQVFRFHAAVSKLGYVVYTESSGTFGITACGMPIANGNRPDPVLPDPRTQHRLSHHVGGGQGHTRAMAMGDNYYRLLANKSCNMLYWEHLKKMPAPVQQKIARANTDYNQVIAKMVYRHTLSRDRGVEWTNPTDSTRVVFSYKKARYTYPGMTGAVDLTAGKPVALGDTGFMAEPSHTYRITCRPM